MTMIANGWSYTTGKMIQSTPVGERIDQLIWDKLVKPKASGMPIDKDTMRTIVADYNQYAMGMLESNQPILAFEDYMESWYEQQQRKQQDTPAEYKVDLRVRGAMTTCGGCDKHDKQKHCKYYKQASFAQRCMHLRWEKYCDCIEK